MLPTATRERERDREKKSIMYEEKGETLLTTATEYYGGGKVIYSTKSDIRRVIKRNIKKNSRKCINIEQEKKYLYYFFK